MYVQISAMNLTGGAFSSIAAGASMSEAKVARLRLSLLGVQAAVGGVLAVLGTRFLAGAYTDAGKFQLAMTNVGIAAGASAVQIKALSREVIALSNTTAQSAVTTAQQYATIARSGLNNPAQLSALGPEIVKFADVQQFLSGANPVTTAKLGTQLVHLFQAYTPKTMGPLLNEVNRLMMMQPEDLSRVVRQASYFVPIAHGLGMSDTEAVEIMAAMGRTGLLLGKGGTGAANAILGGINAVTVTGHLQDRQLGALHALGVIGPGGKNIMFDAHGQVTMLPLLQKLASERGAIDAAGGPGTFMNDLMAGFGKQGGRFLATLATPTVMQQLALMQPKLFGPHALPGVETSWEQYVKTLPFLTQQFQTNLNNLGLVLATPSMGLVISGIGKLVTSLGSMVQFFEAHPDMANLVMGGVAAGTVGFGVISAAALLGMARIGFGGLVGRVAPVAVNPAVEGVFARVAGGGIGGTLLALFAALKAFESLPDLAVMFHNWWARSKDSIYFNIGYAFAAITDAVAQGAQMLWRFATATLHYLFSSPKMLQALTADIMGQPVLAQALQGQAYNNAVRSAGGLLAGTGTPVTHQLLAGSNKYWTRKAGADRPSNTGITLNLGGLTINSATSDPRKLGDLVVRHIARSLPFALRATGGSLSSPRLATATIGGGVWGDSP